MKLSQKKIRKILKRENKLDIQFKIKGNIVFLNGTVDSYNEYLRIGKIIGRIKGVKGVVNNVIYPDFPKKIKKQYKNEVIRNVDVLIIGGGVIGCSIARELSKYKSKILLVEKLNDVGSGTTKANNAMVHTGIGEKKGSLKQKL